MKSDVRYLTPKSACCSCTSFSIRCFSSSETAGEAEEDDDADGLAADCCRWLCVRDVSRTRGNGDGTECNVMSAGVGAWVPG